MITEDFRGQQKDVMKKSLTDNRNMTVEEVVGVMVYRPYGETLKVMVDDQERIHIAGETWVCILDHNTGDFLFKGELHKYYEVDTISSIRDCFGGLYSVFNVMWDSIERNTWIEVEKQDLDLPKKRVVFDKENRVSSERVLQYKKDYYWRNREKIQARRKEKYEQDKKIHK